MTVKVQHFFDVNTSTLTYVVWSEAHKNAIVIDPVLDFDPINAVVHEGAVQKLVDFLEERDLKLCAILETHVHADHWTGASALKKRFPDAKVFMSRQVVQTVESFAYLFPRESVPNPKEIFDVLVGDGDSVEFEGLSFKVFETPGHTPACVSYFGHGYVFVGDSLFMPDTGTGRCDFPGGSAEQLFDSITQKIYTLPGETSVMTGHDYQTGGRDLQFAASVQEHLQQNIRLNGGTDKKEFIERRKKRDDSLSLPKLIFSSLQINLKSGQLPEQDPQGRCFLNMPFWVQDGEASSE